MSMSYLYDKMKKQTLFKKLWSIKSATICRSDFALVFLESGHLGSLFKNIIDQKLTFLNSKFIEIIIPLFFWEKKKNRENMSNWALGDKT